VAEPITDADLEAIHKRCAAATPGPWLVDGDYLPASIYASDSPDWKVRHQFRVVGMTDYEDGGVVCREDAEFIAAARSDIPALLAEVDRLRAERDAAQFAVRELLDARGEIARLRGELADLAAGHEDAMRHALGVD
jgi:glutathione S-transferase